MAEIGLEGGLVAYGTAGCCLRSDILVAVVSIDAILWGVEWAVGQADWCSKVTCKTTRRTR